VHPRHLFAIALIGAALLAPACGSSTPAPAEPVIAAPAAEAPAPASEPGLSVPAAPVPAGWQPVETDRFAVAFPAEPEREETVEETDVGPSPTTMWSLETGGAWLGLSVNDFPAGSMADAAPADVLAGARDGALGNVGGTLVADRAVSIAAPGSTRPVPGLEYQGTSAEFDIKARMFLQGDRLYQLIMVYPPDHADPGLYDRFVGSFELR
jgi:hypothetical protein